MCRCTVQLPRITIIFRSCTPICSNSLTHSSKIFPIIQAFLFNLYTKGRGNLDVCGNERGLDDFPITESGSLLPAIIIHK